MTSPFGAEENVHTVTHSAPPIVSAFFASDERRSSFRPELSVTAQRMAFAACPHAAGALISSTASAGTGTFFASPSKIRIPLSAAASSRASLVVAGVLGAAAALVDVDPPLADGSSEHPATVAATSAGIAIQLIFTVRPLVVPTHQAIGSDQPGTEHDNEQEENLGYTPRNQQSDRNHPKASHRERNQVQLQILSIRSQIISGQSMCPMHRAVPNLFCSGRAPVLPMRN
ncbi:hypothetical protein IU479_09800 [Nocardia abscessus]|uniref:hypothetical protein n=1 Tax=Nocardia abscessus TaxID=120957 RepID=UPI001895BBA6|nr:hypothetical protein [Nocardia abscessus]MBF6218401.1 hypothetical protein [Nocardia abscessus]